MYLAARWWYMSQVDWNGPEGWYQYHREDYNAVQNRLEACRNVMLHGRKECAVDMLKKSCVNAILSIQTGRERHERAFTAYYGGDASLETACQQTVYGYQKSDWLHDAFANFEYERVVQHLRRGDISDAQQHLVDNHTGLSWTKSGFALAMVGIYERACPDSRTRDVLDIDHRIRTEDQYRDALQQIDERLDIDVPLFVKQYVIYDYFAGEHAQHMPFFTEALLLYKKG